MKNIYVVLTLLLFPLFVHAQTIEGKVVDEKGVAVIGANIVNTSMNTSTVSDMDGSFKIKANSGDKIKVSMIGYQTATADASQGMQVVLKDEVNQLQDIVVIGYGTRKKVDNTTVISSIKAEEITKVKVLNASQAIQGKAAGVQVIASDSPGATPTVVIRGLGTAIGGRNPLYIVDGMPTENINNINSNDILTYDILKDASAKAVYGNRAANGVIIITTKKGKSGKMSVDVDSFIGFRSPQSVVKMAGSNKFSYYTNMALGSTTFSQDQPVNTDWFKEITRTGQYSQNNISLSGANENINYFFSVGYYDESAILDGMGYNRLTFRNNNDYKISSKIKLSQNFSIGYTRATPKPFSAFTNAYKQSPIVPVYFSTGQYGVSFVGNDGFASTTGSSFNNVGNPVAQLDLFDEKQKSILAQGGLKLDIELLKELKFSSVFNGEYYSWKGYNFNDTKAAWLAADPTRDENNYPTTSNINSLTRANDSYFNWNISNYLTYNKVFADIHDLELTAGIEASSIGARSYSEVIRKNVNPNSNYWSLNGVDYASNVTNLKDILYNERRLSSYFGRVQYKLMNKYLFTGTIRRDGSSQFSKDNRWGTFPSFGLGWIITNEDFAKNIKGVNMLKLRGGWGKTGNQNVPLNSQSFKSGLDYYLPSYLSGTTVSSQIDPNLGWEVTEETSVGLDFELLNSRLTGSFDVYNKNTNNLILNTRPYITSGTEDTAPAHVGEVSNKGFEISLRWSDKINDDLNYFVSGNFSNNKNKLESLSDSNIVDLTGGGLGNGQYTKLLGESAVGLPLGSFYLYEYAGYDPSNGQMLYYKEDGSTTTQGGLEEADRKFFGSVLPKSTYGLSVGFNYKNFDFSVDSYGTLGAKVYNGKKAQRFSGENIEDTVASNFWTANNTTAGNPAAFNYVPVASTYYLESGDFWRINNITIGYKLPKFTEAITSARVYFNAINPFITKKFSGFTPELNGDRDPYGSQGIELDAYPTLKSFVLGVNLKF